MNFYKFLYIILLAEFFATPAIGQDISRDSRLLSECEMIYSYTAQWLQLQNNAGAAVSALRRSTILTTANMMSNAEDGKVPGWKIQIWTELRPAIKDKFSNKELDPLAEATRCDKEAMPLAINIRNQRLMLWGHDFDGLQQKLMNHMRNKTGI